MKTKIDQMIYKDGTKAKIGDIVIHPFYMPTGVVENTEGDIRIPYYGYEANAVKDCIKRK